jgi:hypothetical protein
MYVGSAALLIVLRTAAWIAIETVIRRRTRQALLRLANDDTWVLDQRPNRELFVAGKVPTIPGRDHRPDADVG